MFCLTLNDKIDFSLLNMLQKEVKQDLQQEIQEQGTLAVNVDIGKPNPHILRKQKPILPGYYQQGLTHFHQENSEILNPVQEQVFQCDKVDAQEEGPWVEGLVLGDQEKIFQSDNSNNADNNPEIVVEQYPNGSRYEGQKLNEIRQGKGKFIYPDGAVYDGEWYQNEMHGMGTLYYSSGELAYQGVFACNQFEGEGILFNDDPKLLNGELDLTDLSDHNRYYTRYEGGFHEDNKEGFGKLYLSNSDRFEGYFLNDKVSGPGKYFHRNGQITEGQWLHNKRLT